MERYKNFVRIEQMKENIRSGRNEEALELAEMLDPSKVRNSSDINIMADLYLESGMLSKAGDCLMELYSRKKTRSVLMQLINLMIRLKRVNEAEKYYREFKSLAPSDFYNHIFRYNIDKIEGKPYDVLISSLEKLKSAEYIDSWAYELAKLYHKSGDKDKCVAECNDIEIWFGDGEYVERARTLKAYYTGEIDLSRNPVLSQIPGVTAEKKSEKPNPVEKAAEETEATEEVRQDSIRDAEDEATGDEVLEIISEAVGDTDDNPEDSEMIKIDAQTEAVEEVQEEVLQDEESQDEASQDEELQDEAPQDEESQDEAPQDEELQDVELQDVAPQDEELQNEAPQDVESQDEELQDEEPQEVELQDAASQDVKPQDVEPQDAESQDADSRDVKLQNETTSVEYSAESNKEEMTLDDFDDYEIELAAEVLAEIDGVEVADYSKAVEEVPTESTPEEPATADTPAESMPEESETEQEPEEVEIGVPEIVTHDFKGIKNTEIPADSLLAKFLEKHGAKLEDYFGFFAFQSDVRAQIIKNVEILLKPQIKNLSLVVSGERNSGVKGIVKGTTKILYQSGFLSGQQVAFTDADKINSMKLEEKTGVLLGCCLAINRAGSLSASSARQLIEFNEKHAGKTAIVLSDYRSEINKLLRDNRELNSVFPLRIHIPAFDIADLEDLVFFKLDQDGYRIDKGAYDIIMKELRRIAREAKEGSLAETDKYIGNILDKVETRRAQKFLSGNFAQEIDEYEDVITKADVIS